MCRVHSSLQNSSASNALTLSPSEDSAVTAPIHTADRLSCGEMGRAEAGRWTRFQWCADGEAAIKPIICRCWRFLQVVRIMESWHGRAFIHRLLQNQSGGSSQVLA